MFVLQKHKINFGNAPISAHWHKKTIRCFGNKKHPRPLESPHAGIKKHLPLHLHPCQPRCCLLSKRLCPLPLANCHRPNVFKWSSLPGGLDCCNCCRAFCLLLHWIYYRYSPLPRASRPSSMTAPASVHQGDL